MENENINKNENITRFTEAQLVEYWKISKNTLRKWRTIGYGPLYVKVGGRVLYRREDIENFENENLYRCSSEKIQTQNGGVND